ncbi:LETM1-domain-containing protein [Auricularia subglabra TFB-10046 SS5]|nr:LETM1-domain-containing protein [Auricularia subglabra TFB-10046 SS5]
MLSPRHALTTATASRHLLRARYPPNLVFAVGLGARRYLHPAPVRRAAAEPSKPNNAEKAAAVPQVQKEPLLPRIWAKVKHEASHYWHGSKLLVSEIRISRRLLFKLLRGTSLTRREYRQLRRTTQDLLRLIPFAVFVAVPFMEFLLPVALKLFPNMLPSTFEDKFAAEEKARKLLRMRIEMAKFLQETVRESGLKANAKIMGSKEFKDFFQKVRSTGESPSRSDIINVAKLFDNDLTLTNMSRPQLVSMCRYMGLNAFGTDNYLRGLINNRLEQIKRDDSLIAAEGIDELSTSELQQACQSRGIQRAVNISPARLRDELKTWIELHINEGVSGALLILCRAFAFDRRVKDDDDKDPIILSLEAVLSGLPDTLLNEAELEVESDQASYKQMLDVLEQQEELIEDEAEQEQKEMESKRARKEAEERARSEEEARTAQMLLPDSELNVHDDARMTMEQVKELGEALTVLSSKSSILKERDALRELVDESKDADAVRGASRTPGSKVAKRLTKMLDTIDKQLDAYDAKVGSSLQIISCDPQGRISVEDLKQALRVIRHAPDEEDVDAIVAKLDVDKDGFVQLEHVLELAKEDGMGFGVDEDARSIIGQGKEIKDLRPKKADIVHESE